MANITLSLYFHMRKHRCVSKVILFSNIQALEYLEWSALHLDKYKYIKW